MHLTASLIRKHPQTRPDKFDPVSGPCGPGKLTTLTLTAGPATEPGSGASPPPPDLLPAFLPRLSLNLLPNCIRIPAGNQRTPTWGSVGEFIEEPTYTGEPKSQNSHVRGAGLRAGNWSRHTPGAEWTPAPRGARREGVGTSAVLCLLPPPSSLLWEPPGEDPSGSPRAGGPVSTAQDRAVLEGRGFCRRTRGSRPWGLH